MSAIAPSCVPLYLAERSVNACTLALVFSASVSKCILVGSIVATGGGIIHAQRLGQRFLAGGGLRAVVIHHADHNQHQSDEGRAVAHHFGFVRRGPVEYVENILGKFIGLEIFTGLTIHAKTP